MRLFKRQCPSLPLHFDIIDRKQNVEPAVDGVQIMRLDEDVLLLDPRYQSNPMLTFGTALLCFGLYFGAWMTPSFLAKTRVQGIGIAGYSLAAWAFFLLCGVFFVAMCAYVLSTLFSRTASPILFNRKTRKVYGSFRGEVMEFDWKDISAVTTQGTAVSETGSMTFTNLYLVNFVKSSLPRNQRYWRGFIVTTGGLGSGSAAALYAFMCAFMEGEPDKLPPTEIHPSNTSWTNRFLQQGPYGDFHSGEPLTLPLRARKGIPPINPFVTILVICFWIGIPFSLWQAWIRPRTKIPEKWMPPPATGPNPFKLILSDANDEWLQKKAAVLVILWSITCTGTGFWIWYSVVMWFRNFGH